MWSSGITGKMSSTVDMDASECGNRSPVGPIMGSADNISVVPFNPVMGSADNILVAPADPVMGSVGTTGIMSSTADMDASDFGDRSPVGPIMGSADNIPVVPVDPVIGTTSRNVFQDVLLDFYVNMLEYFFNNLLILYVLLIDFDVFVNTLCLVN